jgi:hypothetical protein
MKKEHSIFKAIVQVDNQEDCDIAREICERYELPMWNDVTLAFDYVDYDDDPTYLQHQPDDRTADEDHIGFYVDNLDRDINEYDILSIEEFEALANDYNPQFDNMEDILSTMKELNNLINNK